eukprot:COSAG03_NODE_1122_length_4774_cov_59.335401_2_plen_129_part_00
MIKRVYAVNHDGTQSTIDGDALSSRREESCGSWYSYLSTKLRIGIGNAKSKMKCSYRNWAPSTTLYVLRMPRRPLLSWLLMSIKSLSTSTCTRSGRPRFQGILLLAFALEKLFATLRGAPLDTSLFVC